MDAERFKEVCDQVVHLELKKEGIGTLSEKTVHAVLKYYYESNMKYHEVKVAGKVADIKKENEIIEIQTRHFHLLRSKLDRFLKDYSVTVVYPIARTKYIRWINEETGEISPKRKSPKSGRPQQVFNELYKIKDYIANQNFHLIVVIVDVEEFRILNGWSKDKKKGSTCSDRIPIRLIEEITIDKLNDYKKLIP